MDAARFDVLARALTAAQSRRDLIRLLGSLALGGPLAVLGLAEAKRKKKRRKKKRRDGCPVGADYCKNGAPTCHGEGWCLQVQGGDLRCGIEPGNECVICASNQDCVDVYGEGAFCAKRSGAECGCPSNQPTFCAIPWPLDLEGAPDV